MRESAELKQERMKLWCQSKDLLDQAERENRDLTTGEKKDFTRWGLEMDQLTLRIREAEGKEEAQRQEALEIADAQDPARHPASGQGQRWRDLATGREVRVFGPGDASIASHLAAHGVPNEYPGLGFGQFLRSMICGPRSDVERRALSEGTDSAGGYLVPTILSATFIDALRAKLVTQAAGAQILPLTTDTTTIAKLASDPTPAWRAENAAVSESDPTFTAITLSPQTLAVVCKASREVVEDAPNIEAVLEAAFSGSMSVELDRVALLGSGTAPEPQGISGTTDVNNVSMGTNGAALSSYDELIDLAQSILDDDGEMPSAAIMAPRTWAAFGKLSDTTSQPLRRPPILDGLQFHQTTSVPVNQTQGTSSNASEIIVGGFAHLIIGIRMPIRVEVLRERYADVLQYGFLAYLRADIGVTQPKAFGELKGIIP